LVGYAVVAAVVALMGIASAVPDSAAPQQRLIQLKEHHRRQQQQQQLSPSVDSAKQTPLTEGHANGKSNSNDNVDAPAAPLPGNSDSNGNSNSNTNDVAQGDVTRGHGGSNGLMVAAAAHVDGAAAIGAAGAAVAAVTGKRLPKPQNCPSVTCPNTGTEPQFNGVGVTASGCDDSYRPQGRGEFKTGLWASCCDAHRACYAALDNDKESCDWSLRSCTRTACASISSFSRLPCRFSAESFYLFMRADCDYWTDMAIKHGC